MSRENTITTTVSESSLDIQAQILEVCSELVKEKRKISVSILYNRLRRELKYPPIVARNGIDNLIREKKIVPDSFLIRNKVLENKTREKIYSFISSIPSVTASDIKKKVLIGNHVTAWNIQILLDFGFIKQIPIGKRHIFADLKTNNCKALLFYYVRKPEIKKLLALLSEKPSKSKYLVDNVPIKRNRLMYYINIFKELGVIEENNIDGKKYSIQEKYMNIVNEIIKISDSISIFQKLDANTIKKQKVVTKDGIIVKQDKIKKCVVHKGSIKGISYTCSVCGNEYCINCVKSLLRNQEDCWVCKTPFEIQVSLEEIEIVIEEFTPPSPAYKGKSERDTYFYQKENLSNLISELDTAFEEEKISVDDYQKQKEDYQTKLFELNEKYEKIEMNLNEQVMKDLEMGQKSLGYIQVLKLEDNSELFGRKTGIINLSVKERQAMDKYINNHNVTPGVVKRIGMKINKQKLYSLIYQGKKFAKFILVFNRNPGARLNDDIKQLGEWIESNTGAIINKSNLIEEVIDKLFNNEQELIRNKPTITSKKVNKPKNLKNPKDPKDPKEKNEKIHHKQPKKKIMEE